LHRLEARILRKQNGSCFLFNMHCVNRDNIGDMASSPMQYFEGLRASQCGTVNIDWFDNGLAAFDSVLRPNDFTVIGGGGLLAFSYNCDTAIQRACSNGSCAVWSIGYNKLIQSRNLSNIVSIVESAHSRLAASLSVANGLLSLRDSVILPPNSDWMPDATCMLPF